MAEAKLDFTADSKVAQSEIDKLTKKVTELGEKMRQTNQTSKRGAQEAASAQQQLISQLVTSVATFGTVGMAVSTVNKFYSDWRQHTDDLADAHKQLGLTITRVLAEAGKLHLAPEAERFVRRAVAGGASSGQATAAIAGVMESGETLSDKRTTDIAEQIIRLGPTGMDLTKGGALAADIADVMGEGTGAADIADLTVGLKQMLRGKTDTFQNPKMQRAMEELKRKGMSGEDALTAGVAALQSEQGAEALHKFVDKDKPTGRMTREERLRHQEEQAMLADVFAPQKLEGIREQLRKMTAGDLVAGQVAALGTSNLTRQALLEQQVQQARSQAELGGVTQANAEANQARQFIRERARMQDGFAQISAATDTRMWWAFDVVRTPNARSEIESAERGGMISKEDAAAFISALNNLATVTKQAAQGGKKVNVDGHNE